MYVCGTHTHSHISTSVVAAVATAIPEEEARKFVGLEEVENNDEKEEEESVKKNDCGSEVEKRLDIENRREEDYDGGGHLNEEVALQQVQQGGERVRDIFLSPVRKHIHTLTHTHTHTAAIPSTA